MRELCRQDAGQEARGNRARQLDTPPAEGIWPLPGRWPNGRFVTQQGK
jgi:hypothetical protein